MSYDFALSNICPHEVKFESVAFVPGSLVDVAFPRPPINQNVTLYIDGVSVSSNGLYSTPKLPFSNREPYRIEAGKNDLLYVRSGSEIAQIVQLQPGFAVSASDMVYQLGLQLPNLAFSVENGHVIVTARQAGPMSTFSFPDPRWTDKTNSLPNTARILGGLASVGITPGRVVSSFQLYPSWDLMRDPNSPVERNRILRFASPIRNQYPVFELSYSTAIQDCRRCNGTRIEFDYNIVNGTYEIVSGADLLVQEADKFIFTRIGSHFKWPWLGSRLIDRIGGKGTTSGITVSSMITMDISQSFKYYQNVKSQQDTQAPQQKVSDEEFPAALGDIQISQPPDDPTIAIVVATLVSRSREPITLKRVIGSPSPFLLQGSNISFNPRLGSG